MGTLSIILGAGLVSVVALMRCPFLAPTRAGWLMYLPQALGDMVMKRFRVPRQALDAGMAVAGLSLLAAGGLAPSLVLSAGCILLLLELRMRMREAKILSAVYTIPDRTGIPPRKPESQDSPAWGFPSPSVHPDLCINLLGPFVRRVPNYELGTLLVDQPFELTLFLGNHTFVPTQTPMWIDVELPEAIAIDPPGRRIVPPVSAASCPTVRWTCRATKPSGPGTIRLHVQWGSVSREIEAGYERCLEKDSVTIASAEIRRYPGGCRAAFAWRGDMDLYDTSTLQSIEGLEASLGLGARYCFPQTVYLSTRLSLDEAAAQEWADHYGVDRGAKEIPRFVQWMRDQVDLRHEAAYPFRTEKRFLIELGNHGHLHYGTDAAAAKENGWRAKSTIGAGVYSWIGEDHTAYGEQRDNALEARRWIEAAWGYRPKSWAKPHRANDGATAAAMEAAGCEVLSGSDIKPKHNVLLQPPPHHPGKTQAVELTTRYPGDPQTIAHVDMLRFWLHRSHRKGIPMIFMCHQHMRQFDSHACTRFTEYVLRYVLTRFHGDFHCNTVFGIGKYWREVLSEKTRRVNVQLDRKGIGIQNDSDSDFRNVPLDLVTTRGDRITLLVDLPSGRRTHIKFPRT